jgi:hypothetical protein
VVGLYKLGTYTLSNEILIIFGALLTHHLGLLFNKRKEYSPDDKINNGLPELNKKVESVEKEENLG